MENINSIREQLLSGDLKHWKYHKFVVYEPKKRIISAAPIEQRVIQHALMNICHSVFERFQIFDSYASRPGKGTHKAVLRLKEKVGRFRFFVKLDVKKYFDSVNHDVLRTLLEKIIKDVQILRIFYTIIESHGKKEGLPIGNLTSQYFANYYLAYLDHYMKEVVKAPFYIRYMDDVVMLNEDKIELRKLVNEYINYANQKLKLQIKPPIIGRSCKGVDFLGYKVYKDKIMIGGRGKKRFRKNLKKTDALFEKSQISENGYRSRLSAIIGYAQFADSEKFLRKWVKHQ